MILLGSRRAGTRGTRKSGDGTGIGCDGFTKPILYGIAFRLGLCAIKARGVLSIAGVCGEDPKLVDVVQRVPEKVCARQTSQLQWYDRTDGGILPDKCEDHARPQEHNTSNRPSVLVVSERSLTGLLELRQQALSALEVRAGKVRTLARGDVSVCKGVGERKHASKD